MSEDDVVRRLVRIPYEELYARINENIYERPNYSIILSEAGWTMDEFREESKRRFSIVVNLG